MFLGDTDVGGVYPGAADESEREKESDTWALHTALKWNNDPERLSCVKCVQQWSQAIIW